MGRAWDGKIRGRSYLGEGLWRDSERSRLETVRLVGGGLLVPVITLVGSFFLPPCLLSLEEPELPSQPSCAHPWVSGQAEGILGRGHEKLRKSRL